MLHILIQSVTALVCLWVALHLIGSIVMIYSAMLTRPKSLNLRHTLGGLWVRMWPMHKQFWHNPIRLIYGALGGIWHLKRQTKDGKTLHQHYSEMAENYAKEMEDFPYLVLSAIAKKLNEAKIGDEDDNSVVHIETLVIELYRGLHPNCDIVPVADTHGVNAALEILREGYGPILVEVVRTISVKYPYIVIPVGDMEQRVLHYCLFAAEHIDEKGFVHLPLNGGTLHPSIKR